MLINASRKGPGSIQADKFGGQARTNLLVNPSSLQQMHNFHKLVQAASCDARVSLGLTILKTDKGAFRYFTSKRLYKLHTSCKMYDVAAWINSHHNSSARASCC